VLVEGVVGVDGFGSSAYIKTGKNKIVATIIFIPIILRNFILVLFK
jgi:hypothetical protein